MQDRNGTTSPGNSPHAVATDPSIYAAGAEFVAEHAQHVPNLYVSVSPLGIMVQAHPTCTLAEQFQALHALAQRLGVSVLPSDVRTSEAGWRFYTNDFHVNYSGVEVHGFQHVRVDELVAS
jgi:hypothetical protein